VVSNEALHSRAKPWTAEELEAIRSEFPLLASSRRPVVYLDNAATSQRPQVVLGAMDAYYREANANVHRGVYGLAVDATRRYENARRAVAEFLRVDDPDEVVFVRGVTEAVNLVAQSFVRPQVGPGDEILITLLEHHSNFVPWQLVAEQTGATLRVAGVTDDGELDLEDFRSKLGERTRFVSITACSNAIGTVPPLETILSWTKAAGVPVLVDGAQASAHGKVHPAELGADFYALSGHKIYGPTGIGALWGASRRLKEMPPWQGGGDMIREVRIDGVDFAEPPQRFEAGTPNIAGAIGLGAAVQFLERLDRDAVLAHEEGLLEALVEGLDARERVRIVGRPARRASVVSFVIEGAHSQDVATLLDEEGICLRVGHHCAQPLLHRLGHRATLRASVAAFNDETEIGRLLEGIDKAMRILGAGNEE